jgi:hypothetical protein
VILRPLANTVVLASLNQNPRPMDVGFYGILSDVDAKCDAAGDTIRAALNIVIAAERGPAAKGDSVELDYFVAVTGPDQTVISKKNFAVRIAFPEGAKRAGVTDHLEEAISLAGRRPGDLTINIGFQQSRQAADYLKNFRTR